MTAPRRPRSAWLLVGWTPGTPAKLHSAGQRFSRFFAKLRWRRLRALLRAASSRERPQLLLERAGALKQAGTVSVPAELSPGGEQPCGDLEAGRAEVLLGAEALAVGGEVARQVGESRAGVAAGRGSRKAHQRSEQAIPAKSSPSSAWASRRWRPSALRKSASCPLSTPLKRAPLAGRAPTGLLDVDGGRGAHVIAKPGVRLLERGARSLHDGIDRSARETATEELARELFGCRLPSGTIDAIVQAAGAALEKPQARLRDHVLSAPAVNIEKTGWRTASERRTLQGRAQRAGGTLPQRRGSPPPRGPGAARRGLRGDRLLGPLVGLSTTSTRSDASSALAHLARDFTAHS